MGKEKFQMPTAKYFINNRVAKHLPTEPPWVFLEREMRQNKKPYNEEVGEWLIFLRDLKKHYRQELIQQKKRLERDVGPSWFVELSSIQRTVLDGLRFSIHKDLIENHPTFVERSLKGLGLTLNIPHEMLMDAMLSSAEDPGVFVWNLYTYYYKVPPSKKRRSYDYNSRLLMSSLVYIDYKECLQLLDEVMEKEPAPPPKPAKPPPKYFQPDVRYGEYLQKMHAPSYSNQKPKKKRVVRHLKRKLRLRNAESFEKILEDHNFLEKRRERNIKEQAQERVCTYKFWEPPACLRFTDPKMRMYAMALRMFKKRAKPKYLKHKPPYDNIQCSLGGVCYTGGKPNFVINTVCVMPTGYVPINGGMVKYQDQYITNIFGFWKFPGDDVDKCQSKCDCVAKWESSVMKYLEESKCKCHHLYDFKHEGKATEKFFHKPTKHGPFWFDQAKIFQLDPVEDFIKDTVRAALKSESTDSSTTFPEVSALGMKPRELLMALLGELADSPLIMPHLPDANLIKSLQVYVCKKVKPPLTKKQHQTILCHSKRRWCDLQHLNFRSLATCIDFTQEELENFSWNQRELVQALFVNLLNKFMKKNRRKQIEQTRMFWATMENDRYGGKSFRDCFFSYFPTRDEDLFLLNPYAAETIDKFKARTCKIYW